MESDVKQSEQAQHLTKVSSEAPLQCMSTCLCVYEHVTSWLSMCLKQKEEDTCLGTALTAADAAYVFSSSQLSTPEEGDTLH